MKIQKNQDKKNKIKKTNISENTKKKTKKNIKKINNIKETFKSHGVYSKVCPECGSIDIEQEKDNPLSAEGLPERWICQKCGHSSQIFPEVAIDKIPKFQEIARRNMLKDQSEKVDLSYGRFEVNIMWKLTGPLIFIAGIIMLFIHIPADKGLIFPFLIMFIGAFMIYITYNKKRRLFNQ
jgi:hypothetical protein